MAVRTLSYRDLTPEQRRAGAAKMRGRLMGALSHPFITHDQQQAIFQKVALIDKWEKLAIEVVPPQPLPALPALPAAPEDPILEVGDIVDVSDSVK